jgi:hypothetical protein
MGSAADVYPDGAMRSLKEPLDLSQISEMDWGMDGYGGRGDLVFSAQFSPHTVYLPIPPTIWLLGCGIVAIAGIRRIRIKKAHP